MNHQFNAQSFWWSRAYLLWFACHRPFANLLINAKLIAPNIQLPSKTATIKLTTKILSRSPKNFIDLTKLCGPLVMSPATEMDIAPLIWPTIAPNIVDTVQDLLDMRGRKTNSHITSKRKNEKI